MSSRIGKFIKEYRKEKNLTQFQLAEKLGLSEFYISALETGARQPGKNTLIKLCNETHRPMEFFLDMQTEYSIKVQIQELYDRISKLPLEHQKHVINIIDCIISEFTEK